MADNSITLVGNLTRDPELRFTATGRGVASFGIAVGRRYQVNGEWKEAHFVLQCHSVGSTGRKRFSNSQQRHALRREWSSRTTRVQQP